MSNLSALRKQIVKGMLDSFPELRQFVRGYLQVYYPDEGGLSKYKGGE